MESSFHRLIIGLLFWVEPLLAQIPNDVSVVEIKNWEYHWGDFLELPEPDHYQIGKDQTLWTPLESESLRPPGRGQRTIGWMRARLPDQLEWSNPALLIRGFDLAVHIFIEDQLVFAYGGLDFQGYRHALIRIPKEAAGSYIYVRLFSDHTNLGLFPGILLSNYEDLIFQIIETHAAMFGIGLFFVITALVMGIIGCLNWQRKEILALALTFLCSGLVILFVPPNTLSQLFFPHYLFNHLVFQFAMYSVPAPFSLFLEKMFPARRSLVLQVLRWVCLAYAVGALVLSVSGWVRPMSTLLPGEILILITCAVVFGRVFLAIRDREPHSLIFGVGSLFLFVGTVRDICVEMGFLSDAFLPVSLHYWVLAFFICMIIALIRSITMAYQLVDQYLGEVKQLNLHLEKKVEEQTLEIKLILQTIEQGILIVDEQGLLTQHYSRYSLRLLDEEQLAMQSLDQAVLSKTDLGEDQRQQITHTLLALIQEDMLLWELNAPTFPRFFHLRDGMRQLAIEAEWTPFLDEHNRINRILLTLRDVTEILQYRQKAMAHQEEWQDLEELVRVPADKFRIFIDHGFRLVGLCKESIHKDGFSEALRVCLHHLHTLKGNARTLGLRRLSSALHSNEDRLVKQGSAADHEALKHALEQEILGLESLFSEYKRLNEDVLDRGSSGSSRFHHDADTKDILQLIDEAIRFGARYDPLLEVLRNIKERFIKTFCLTLEHMVEELQPALSLIAQSLGKPMPSVSIRGPALLIPSALYSELRDALIHLFNNALDHGLEDATTRRSRGKSPEGHIALYVVVHEHEWILEWSDDGRGLHLGALRQKMKTTYMSEEELASIIFQDHVSTKDSVTELSGRGLGLAAVRRFLKTHGGNIEVVLESQAPGSEFRPFKFILRLPTRSLQDNRPRLQRA